MGICIIALISLYSINNAVGANTRQLQNIGVERAAIMLLDAMVKNNNAKNPLLGAAVFDMQKHRVEENNIDVALLKAANPIVSENLFVKKLELFFQDGATETIIANSAAGKNCLSVERLVLAQGKKALLRGVVCVE